MIILAGSNFNQDGKISLFFLNVWSGLVGNLEKGRNSEVMFWQRGFFPVKFPKCLQQALWRFTPDPFTVSKSQNLLINVSE